MIILYSLKYNGMVLVLGYWVIDYIVIGKLDSLV